MHKYLENTKRCYHLRRFWIRIRLEDDIALTSWVKQENCTVRETYIRTFLKSSYKNIINYISPDFGCLKI